MSANLRRANFTGALLRGASLHGSVLNATVFIRADLTNSLGLPGTFEAVNFTGANLCGSGFETETADLDAAEATLSVDTICPLREDDGRCITNAGDPPDCHLFEGPPEPPAMGGAPNPDLPGEAGPLCLDGIDNDGDGNVDCRDVGCNPSPNCEIGALCGDAQDNDGDGLADCLDPGCVGAPACP